MLNRLKPETLAKLKSASQEQQVSKGTMLFHEGKIPQHVYFVIAGKLKLYTTDQLGREQIVHLATNGDIMGYRAVLGGDSLSCSCSALEDSLVMGVPKETFLNALDTDAEFSFAVIRLLTQELRDAEHHLAGLARKSVRARIAEVLLILADKFGYESDGETINVSLSREEMAGLVGTATETAIRLLHSLRDDGLLATTGKKIRLIDKSGLKRTAQDM
jgi:CRP/FNR family transcriptional regulator